MFPQSFRATLCYTFRCVTIYTWRRISQSTIDSLRKPERVETTRLRRRRLRRLFKSTFGGTANRESWPISVRWTSIQSMTTRQSAEGSVCDGARRYTDMVSFSTSKSCRLVQTREEPHSDSLSANKGGAGSTTRLDPSRIVIGHQGRVSISKNPRASWGLPECILG